MTLDLLRSSRRLGGGAPRLTEARRAVDQAALTELEGGGRPPALQTWASFEESRNCSSMEDSLPVAEEWPCLAMSGGADRHGLGCSCVSGPGSVPAFSSSALYFGDGFVFVLCDTLLLCQIYVRSGGSRGPHPKLTIFLLQHVTQLRFLVVCPRTVRAVTKEILNPFGRHRRRRVCTRRAPIAKINAIVFDH